jgi:hypothetical protein
MAVRLPALRADCALLPGKIPVRGRVNPRAIVPLERLGKLKKYLVISGIEPTTFRFVALCLNQQRYYVPIIN